MTDLLVIALLVLFLAASFGLGALFLVSRILATQARWTNILLAQSDEHLKIGLTYGEKATSRLMAAAIPGSHVNFRQQAGRTADGAQHGTKQHFIHPSLFPEIQKRDEERAQALAEEIRLREDQLRAEARPLKIREVGTQLGFEENGQ